MAGKGSSYLNWDQHEGSGRPGGAVCLSHTSQEKVGEL